MNHCLSERVNRGAKLLDAKHPGWHKEININELNMASCTQCILGQCFGRYGNGLDALQLEDFDDDGQEKLDDIAHGFDHVSHGGASEEDWAELKNLWIRQIQFRLDLEYVHKQEILCTAQ
jgi:hypothetical protein